MSPKSNKLKENKATEPEKVRSNTKKKRTSRSKQSKSNGKNIFTDPRFVRSVGFLFLIAGIYTFLAIVTFVFNWFAADVDPALISKGVAEYVDHTQSVDNWTGKLGSYIADILVYQGIGIGSILVSVIFIALGLKMLLNVRMFSIWRWSELLIISFIWLPVTLSLIFPQHPENLLGGLAGFQIRLFMLSYIGKAGMILGIVLIPVIFFLIDFQFQFRRKGKKEKDKQNDSSSGTKSSEKKEELYNTIEFAVDDNEEELITKPDEGSGNFKVEEDPSIAKEDPVLSIEPS